MSNTEIARCQNCGHLYCIKCSKNKGWQMFCSDKCEKEYDDEFKNEPIILINVFQRKEINVLKIRKSDGNVNPDTEIWLEESKRGGIDINVKLSNCSVPIQIANISEKGMLVFYNIPSGSAKEYSFKTTINEECMVPYYKAIKVIYG